MRHALSLRAALNASNENMEEELPQVHPAEQEVTEDMIEEEVQSGAEEEEMAALSTESRELSALLDLRETSSLAMESGGDGFQMACVLATALEQYGEYVEASPERREEFVKATMESLSSAISKRIKSIKNRFQNLAMHFKLKNKTQRSWAEKNAKMSKDAMTAGSRTFTMTNGAAVNIAIGTRFDDNTAIDIQKSLTVIRKLIAYAHRQDRALRGLGALSRSKAVLTPADIAGILKGNMLTENVPEIKNTVFPGNYVCSNAYGTLPEFTKPSGNDVDWIGDASTSNNAFQFSRLRKTKTATGPVTISAATQQKLVTIAQDIPNLLSEINAVFDFVHDRVEMIFDDNADYDRNGDARVRDSVFTGEGTLIAQYLQTLWEICNGAQIVAKRTSLGIRQVMTNK